MNKNRYRVIYSQARGVFVAVAEIVKSRTKTAGQSSANGATELESEDDVSNITYKKLNPLNFSIISLLGAVIYTIPMSSIGNTQIIADKTAPTSQQATILNTSNGITQVNIQTPSAGGVSRNTYKQFDVGQEGVILNNSRNNVQTQIGGWVQGNPWLAKGEAKVILNEVNSSNPSQLKGYLEVAGKSAQVVIANPSGLVCDGCGVINADRFTLTTGQAVMNQGYLESFRVREGQVTIEGKGLNGSLTPYTDVYARALKVNAGLYANELHTVLGPNDIQVKDQVQPNVTPVSGSNNANSNTTTPQPDFALDVGQLGGMYAGKIYLVGTEQGLGVRNAGSINATTAQMTLNANGDLVNTGNIIANKDQIAIQAQNVKNSGNISSTQHQIHIQANDIQNKGLVATNDQIKLEALDKINNNDGVINAGRIDFTAQNLSNDKGKIEQTGSQQLNITAKALDNSQGLIGQASKESTGTTLPGGNTQPTVTDPQDQSSAQDSSSIEVVDPAILTPKTFEAGQIKIAQDMSNIAGHIINNADISLKVQDSIKNNGGKIQLPELQFNGQNFENKEGQLTAKVINITAQNADNQKGLIDALESFDLNTQQLNNNQGRLQSSKTLNLSSNQIDNSTGHILANDTLILNSEQTNNTEGVIASVNTDAQLNITALENNKGEISAQNVQLNGQTLNNHQGTIQSKVGDLTLKVDRIDNGNAQDSAGSLVAGKNLNITAQHLNSTGQIYAGDTADLTVKQLQQDGQLAARNKIKVQSDSISSKQNAIWAAGLDQDGKLSQGDATLNINAQKVQIAGKVLSGSEIQIDAVQSADLSLSENQAKNIKIQTKQLKTESAKVIADQQLDLTATQNIDNQKGQYSANQINIDTNHLNNDQGLIQHTGQNDFILNIADRIDNNTGKIISNANNTEIKTTSLNSNAGEILHAGNQQLKITAKSLQGQKGTIQSNSKLQLELGATNLDNATTTARNINLNAISLSHQQGQLIQSDANGQLNVNVEQALNNTSGVISAAGGAQLNVTQLNNNVGNLLVDKQLEIKADDINNTQGTVYTDDSLNIIAKHGINNQQGILAAKQAVYVKAQSLDNIVGTLQSEQSKLDLNISSALNNQRGKLLSNQDITIQSLNLNNATGTIFSNQELNLDVDGEIENQSGTIAANNNISVNAQLLDNTSGQIRSEKQHLNIITQQNLKNDSGIIVAAKNVTITAQDLSSQKGQIQAGQHADLTVQSLNNTAGALYADGELKLNALEHLNNQDGVITANQGFHLNAASLSNNAGKLIAQQFAMQLDVANELSNIKGEISAAQDLTMNSGHWNNVEGKAVAGQNLHVNTATLDNHLGVIYAQDQSKIVATGQVNNTSGVIASKQVDLTSQSLLNDLGKIRAEQGSLNLSVDNELSNLSGEIFAQQEANLKAQQINNQNGKIQSILKTKIETNTLDNQSGIIYTQDQLQLLAQSAIQNQQGIIAAQKDLQVNSKDLNNEQGLIQSELGRADLFVQGALNNDQGELSATEALNVVAQGIDNRLGQISSLEKLNLDSQLQTLNNESGKILADQILLKTGLLNNNSGLIQSNSELSIDTNQHDLLNQSFGTHGGILSQGKLNLSHVQQLLNDNGILSSVDDVQISVQQLSNQKGQINSQGNLTIAQQKSGGVLNNQGQIQALKNIQIDTDQLNNSGQGSHIVASEDLSIQAQVIDNRQNLDDTILGGLDAQNIQFNAHELNNQSGGIRASKEASLLIQQNFDNQQGSVTSLGTLLISDYQKTLNINNTQGKLIAQNRLAISANNLINQGKIFSFGDVELNLKQSYRHQHGDELSADGLLKINNEHDFINQSFLSAGQELTVNAQNILNQTGASISSNQTHLIAKDRLHNQGAIYGGLTHLQANTVWNDGAKIYGDHIAIQAQTLDNKSNQDRVGAVIASRGDIDLGINILNNQAGGLINNDSKDNAWILSMGQLKVGSSLDSNDQAQGQAQLINNRSATIESQGDMQLTAKEIQNLNDHFSVHLVLESSTFVHSYEDNGVPGVDIADQIIGFKQDKGFVWLLLKDGRRFRTYNIFEHNKEIYVPEALTSTPGQILSRGDMLLQSEHIINDQSQILAAGLLKVEGSNIENKAYLSNKLIQYKNPKKWFYDSGRYYSMVYMPADETEPYTLSGLYAGNKVIATPVVSIQDKTYESIEANIAGLKQAQVLEYEKQNTQQQQIKLDAGEQIHVKQSEHEHEHAQQFDGVGLNGAQPQDQPIENKKLDFAQQLNASEKNLSSVDDVSNYEVRSVEQKVITLPSNALYSTTKDSQAQYLVETDPAFSQYKNWLSSDYMLSAFGLDPTQQQKRLGDGFYEQRIVQDQIAQLTGRRFLSGYASDEEQYKALMNNGLTFAQSYHLRAGIALTAAQLAQLTSDIVWLEERTITLADGTTRKALVPQVYVRARAGDLKGDGTLISANQVQLDMNGDVLNQATIAGREALVISANNINQLAGRMEANRVGIKTQNDLNNIGSQIVAKEAASLDVGRNLNVSSTLASNHKQQGQSYYSFTAIDRKAGIYVGNNQPASVSDTGDLKTTLNIKVGGNTTLKAAEVLNSNGGTILQTAGDVKLETLQTERINNSYKNKKNYDFGTMKTDVGNQIASKGDLSITGNNIGITASQVSSEQGRTTLSANEHLDIVEGRNSSTYEHADEKKKKSFLKKKTTQTYIRDITDEAIASTVTGKNVLLNANNIDIRGSQIVSDDLTQIQAKNNINITVAENTYLNESTRRVKKSGFSASLSGGSLNLGYSKTQGNSLQENISTHAVGSQIGSIKGDTAIVAGNKISTQATNLSSGQDLLIKAKEVELGSAYNTEIQHAQSQSKTNSFGVSLNLIPSEIRSIQKAGQALKGIENKDGLGMIQAMDQAVLGSTLENFKPPAILEAYKQQNQNDGNGVYKQAIGTTANAGGKIKIQATDGDINIIGSRIFGDKGIELAATNNVNIFTSLDQGQENNANSQKLNGMKNDSASNQFIGSRRDTSKEDKLYETHNSSSIISGRNSDINIIAGKNYIQTGSDLRAGNDINVVAERITIENSLDKVINNYDHQFKQQGINVSFNAPVIQAMQSASDSVQTIGQSKNDRVNAMAVANAGWNAYQVGQSLQTTGTGNTSGNAEKTGTNLFNVNVTYGEQNNHDSLQNQITTAKQSTMIADGKVKFTAAGAEKSDINIIGSDVVGLKGTNLRAEGDVSIKAGQQARSEISDNQTAGWNAGAAISVGNGMSIGFTAGGNYGEGDGKGSALANINSHVGSKGSQTTISSGRTTNIMGGQVQGEGVQIQAKDLNIESLQDLANYKSKQQNVDAQVTVGYGFSASGSYSGSNVKSDYASIQEQSGILTGNDGYQIKVQNNTDLKGAIIASTQIAESIGKNRIETGTLSYSNLNNLSEYDAKSIAVGSSVDAKSDRANQSANQQGISAYNPDNSGVNKSLGFGLDSDKTTSVTQSGINTQNIIIRDEQAQQALTGKSVEQAKAEIKTDVTTEVVKEHSGAIANTFDKDQVQKEINVQAQVTKEFGKNAPKAVGDYAQQQAFKQRLLGNEAEAEKWDEGGIYRVAMHTAIGALSTGSIEGTLTTSGVAASAKTLNQIQSDMVKALTHQGMTEDKAILVVNGMSSIALVGAGNVAGLNTSSVATAVNVDSNNRQLHREEIDLIKKLAKEYAEEKGITEEEAKTILTRGALYNIDEGWKDSIDHLEKSEISQYQEGYQYLKAKIANNTVSDLNSDGQPNLELTASNGGTFPTIRVEATQDTYAGHLTDTELNKSEYYLDTEGKGFTATPEDFKNKDIFLTNTLAGSSDKNSPYNNYNDKKAFLQEHAAIKNDEISLLGSIGSFIDKDVSSVKGFGKGVGIGISDTISSTWGLLTGVFDFVEHPIDNTKKAADKAVEISQNLPEIAQSIKTGLDLSGEKLQATSDLYKMQKDEGAQAESDAQIYGELIGGLGLGAVVKKTTRETGKALEEAVDKANDHLTPKPAIVVGTPEVGGGATTMTGSPDANGGLGKTEVAGATMAVESSENKNNDFSDLELNSNSSSSPNIPKPKIDITDEFIFKNQNGNITMRYGNPEGVAGIIVNVDKNGILGFDIRSAPDHPYMNASGVDMFSSVIQRLNQEGIQVNKIRGAWISGTDSVNTAQYSANLAKGMSPNDAALNTWTGKIAQRHGYTKVEEIESSGGVTYVIFGK